MKAFGLIISACLISLLSACGSPPPSADNVVSGVAAAGIIRGGTVQVFLPYSSLTDADKKLVGTATTSVADGSYSVNLGHYAGPVLVEVSGGSYTDEATNAPATIPASAPLRVALGSVEGSVSAMVTPLTELAVRHARFLDKKLGADSIFTANSRISSLFRVNITGIAPVDPSSAISTGSQAQQDYTLLLAAIMEQGRTNAATLDSTLASLAGGIGADGTLSSAGADSLQAALFSFLNGANNRTGGAVLNLPNELAYVGRTTMQLQLVLAGAGVKSVQTTLTLPSGVSVATDGNGVLLNGVLTRPLTNTSTITTFLTAQFTPAASGAPATLLLGASANIALPVGGIMTLTLGLEPGAAPPDLSAFTLSGTSLTDRFGAQVAGATFTLAQ
jgi:hypothetical protein